MCRGSEQLFFLFFFFLFFFTAILDYHGSLFLSVLRTNASASGLNSIIHAFFIIDYSIFIVYGRNENSNL